MTFNLAEILTGWFLTNIAELSTGGLLPSLMNDFNLQYLNSLLED